MAIFQILGYDFQFLAEAKLQYVYYIRSRRRKSKIEVNFEIAVKMNKSNVEVFSTGVYTRRSEIES